MNEHIPRPTSPQKQDNEAALTTPEALATEHPVRPVLQRVTPDWRRFEVARDRHLDTIAEGIAEALEHRDVINAQTAKCIAHLLSRSLSKDTELAYYAATGYGDYKTLREEYLPLYHHPDAPASARELIDWFGTCHIRRIYPRAASTDYHEPYPLTLDKLLVPTSVTAGEWSGTVHVTGDYDSRTIHGLEAELVNLRVSEDPALQAYLSLANVNAMSGDIMEGFHDAFVATYRDIEAAIDSVCEIDEREREVIDFVNEKGLYFDVLTPNYKVLQEQAEEGHDFVEWGGRVHVFYR
ncbi:hypothetical protein GCM10022198_08650 [Klugiella xanthotipulae]|uniref:Uncharacterized protein n=1 Tax=Klugiella xanthotipulae TaxID=244735 RepID=A0A543I3U7_9MICO|nr:hypothetical protein [Klugiella xanthotipulae]TQM65221.1 hypothetical protein FB466_0011 [Klugiella xanthotipulae]